jgi:hypothetical protein
MNVVPPTKHTDGWHFEFEVEAEGVLSSDISSDELAGLVGDCEGVPMVTGLDEAEVVTATLHAQGTNQNIWFTAINNHWSLNMVDTTDIEKKSLEAHVELCAERYRMLELKIETVEKEVRRSQAHGH